MAGKSTSRINHHSHRRPCRYRSIPISTLMVILILVTVFTNLYLASWILPPLGTSREAENGRISPIVSSRTGYIENNAMPKENSQRILHIVTTRFQQLQPNLLELGKARLKLFETFCLPTMLKQDIQDGFLWFVMTDPDLEPSLMRELENLLRPHPHFYLVASNQKLVTPLQLVSLNQTTEFIRTGDLDRLYHDLFDIHRPLLIETRLDADDGLNGKTLSEIQRMVLHDMTPDTRGWQIICSRIHYEWRNPDITSTILPSATSHVSAKSMSSGKIRLVRERICVTPGYTLVRHRPRYSIDFPAWPRTGHNLIVIEWPECSSSVSNTNNATLTTSTDISYNCWRKLGNFPSAIRSRTITSAGMSRINPNSNSNMYDNQTQLFWDYVQSDFGIMESKAQSTSEYLHNNLPQIVEDNLKGQCTFGHSCKNSSKEKLNELLTNS